LHLLVSKITRTRVSCRNDQSYVAAVHVDVDLRSINLKSFSLVEAAV